MPDLHNTDYSFKHRVIHAIITWLINYSAIGWLGTKIHIYNQTIDYGGHAERYLKTKVTGFDRNLFYTEEKIKANGTLPNHTIKEA